MRCITACLVLGFFSTSLYAQTAKSPEPSPLKTINVFALTFEAKMVNGQKHWLPASAAVREGQSVEITVTNSLPEPHGFFVEDLVPAQTIAAGETKKITIVARGKGVHKVGCQLHPAHVGGAINVQ